MSVARPPGRRLALLVPALLLPVTGACGAAAPSTQPASAASTSAGPASVSASPSASASASPTASSAQAAPAEPEVQRAAIVKHVKAYLADRDVTASVQVRDLETDEVYSYRPKAHYDSASVVKVAIMAAVLRRQEKADRKLTAREVSLLGAMIKRSDNGAASSLYSLVGGASAMKNFYKAAGMTSTTPGPGSYWGLTQVTAADETVLLDHLVSDTSLLEPAGRKYARTLMGAVADDQDWGVSAGPAKAGATVQLKNGWLPRATHGWRVHSIGHVRGDGRDYLVSVLTHDSPTMAAGVSTVEGLSKIVWRDLAP